MSTFRAQKVVSALPATLEADTVYAVRVGTGFDLYITDSTGLLAYQINSAGGGGGSADDFCYLNADYALTSTTSAQKLFNTTTNGRVTLGTGIYVFDAVIYLTGMSATSGNGEFGLLGAGTAVLGGVAYGSFGRDGTSLSAVSAGTLSGAFTTAAAITNRTVAAATGAEMHAAISGIFKVTRAGTLVPSFSLEVASAAVVKAGSYIRFRRLANVSTFTSGSWG